MVGRGLDVGRIGFVQESDTLNRPFRGGQVFQGSCLPRPGPTDDLEGSARLSLVRHETLVQRHDLTRLRGEDTRRDRCLLRTDHLALQWVAKAAYVVLPSLHHFDVRNSLLSGAPIPEGQLVHCFVYTVLYTSALLVATIVVFSRRDFE